MISRRIFPSFEEWIYCLLEKLTTSLSQFLLLMKLDFFFHMRAKPKGFFIILFYLFFMNSMLNVANTCISPKCKVGIDMLYHFVLWKIRVVYLFDVDGFVQISMALFSWYVNLTNKDRIQTVIGDAGYQTLYLLHAKQALFLLSFIHIYNTSCLLSLTSKN